MIIALLPIPADPEPPPAEIQEEAAKRRVRGEQADVAEPMARIAWSVEAQRADPDAFLVPFVVDVDEYNAYRRSTTWRRVRQAKLDAAGGRCQGCGTRATQVHHRDYRPRVLRGEDANALVALCRTCHEAIHAKTGGQSPSWQDQERRLFSLIGAPDTPLNH